MGASLSDLLRDEAECEVAYGNLTINIKYRPGAYTPEAVAEFSASKNVLSDFVQRVVVSWDITDDEGHMLPIEAADKLPVALLGEMVDAINRNMSGKAKDANSDAG